MPNDVKAIVSVVTLIVAAIFAYWEKSNGRQDLFWIVIGLANFSVIAMWVFSRGRRRQKESEKNELNPDSRQIGALATAVITLRSAQWGIARAMMASKSASPANDSRP